MENQEHSEGQMYPLAVVDIAKRCEEGKVRCSRRPTAGLVLEDDDGRNGIAWLCRKHAEPIRHHLAQHAMGEFD